MATPSLQQWPFAIFVRESPWAYPTLEVVHLVGLALVFGTLWLVELRLLGRLREFEPTALARAALPWTLAGFALSVASGLLLFASRADEFIANPAFLAKMGLILAAGVNAAVLHTRGRLDPDRRATRIQAAASLVLWLAVIACGRWIAYV
jgi:uncharacterized membrane protein